MRLIEKPRQIAKSTVLATLRAVRREAPDQLFWWRSEEVPNNFGDLVGPWLFEKIAGHAPLHRRPSNWSLRTVTASVGSILPWTAEDTVVWGTGILDREHFVRRPARTLAVRGPRTRERLLELGYDCPPVFGDPGILVPRFHPDRVERRFEVGLIPHYVDRDEVSARYADRDDVAVIDVLGDVEEVVDRILACETLVSSSLHGLILANAYGRRARHVRFGGRLAGDGVKFADYYGSVGVTEPVDVPLLERAAALPELRRVTADAPDVDVGPLVEPLLAACPFPRRRPEAP